MADPEPKKKIIFKKRVVVLKKRPASAAATLPGDAVEEATTPPAPPEQTPRHSAPPAEAGPEIKFYCIRCGQKLAVRHELKGHQLKCPKCSRHITVPEPIDH